MESTIFRYSELKHYIQMTFESGLSHKINYRVAQMLDFIYYHMSLKLHGKSQGGQSHYQHDGVHGFIKPLKSFITFDILSQISCGKMKKKIIFFCTRLYQSFSWVCCSFQDCLEQLKKKKTENSPRFGSHFSWSR